MTASGPSGDNLAARLCGGAWCRRHLDQPVLCLAAEGFRLRRVRLLRDQPEYGTLADFDALIERVHALGMKLIIDIVPAHCSEQHRWFVESRQSRDMTRPTGSTGSTRCRRLGADKLAVLLRRPRLELGAETPAILPSQFPAEPAEPEPRQSEGSRGDDGCGALLVRPRGRRLPSRCRPYHQWRPRALPGQSAQSGIRGRTVAAGPATLLRQLHDAAQLNQPAIQLFSEAIRDVADTYEDRFLMGEVDGTMTMR